MTCRNCEQAALTTKEELAFQLSLEPASNLIAQAQRETRQNICRACPFYADAICTKCGCYVGFRTALKNKHCAENFWQ